MDKHNGLAMIYRILFSFLIIFLSLNISVFSQHDSTAKKPKKINLLHADIGKFDNISGKSAQRLIGKVKAEHEGSLLFCDSAYLYGNTNSMDAFGNVHIIINDSLDLFGDQLFYNGNTKIAEFHNHVRMVNKKTTLYTDYLVYDRNSGIGEYFVWGKIVDSSNVLTSKKGYYYSNSETVFFRDSVVVVNPDYVMRSDTLKYLTTTERIIFLGPSTIEGDSSFLSASFGFHDTQTKETRLSENAFVQNKSNTLSGDRIFSDKIKGITQVFRNVVMTDTTNDIMITGEYGIYNKPAGYAYVVDSAQAILISKEDTMFLHADTLMLTFDTLEKAQELKAFYHMKFFRERAQGMADSMVYSFNDSIMQFFKKPVFWFDDNQISSDRVDLVIKNGAVDSAIFQNNVFMVSQDTVDTRYYNQVSGQTMYAWFYEKDLRKVFMSGKSETIYFLWEDDGTPIGMNKIQSKDMLIFLKDQELQSITYINKPTATLYPLEQISIGDEKLKSFIWKIDERPMKREDIFIKKEDLVDEK